MKPLTDEEKTYLFAYATGLSDTMREITGMSLLCQHFDPIAFEGDFFMTSFALKNGEGSDAGSLHCLSDFEDLQEIETLMRAEAKRFILDNLPE